MDVFRQQLKNLIIVALLIVVLLKVIPIINQWAKNFVKTTPKTSTSSSAASFQDVPEMKDILDPSIKKRDSWLQENWLKELM